MTQPHAPPDDAADPSSDAAIRTWPTRLSRGTLRACAVLTVFSLHNAWNCFTFLNFTNYAPTEELLGVDSSAVGLLTTVGWLGILSGVPLVPACRWHRSLLFTGDALNYLAPVHRFFAARPKSYAWVFISNLMQGHAFGIIGAWPPLLASLQWPERRHALVTAIASLANYVGGAVGTLAMPAIADSAGTLLTLFEAQAYISAVLGLTTLTWLWIPPFAGHSAPEPRAAVHGCDSKALA